MELVSPILPLRRKRPTLELPLTRKSVPAGFPSPAEDYLDTGIDLNKELIKHPASTFFARVSGHSMNGAGIYDGDLLIVDRSLDPSPGHVVIAILDGAFTLKRLTKNNEMLYLEAEHPNYPSIDLRSYKDIQIWGVVVHSIHHIGATI